jgi:excisionase family DNA binding protein
MQWDNRMNSDIQELLTRPTLTVDEAARVLRIGRNAAYEYVRSGELEAISMGKRRLVLTAPLRRKLGIEVAA